MDDGMIVRPVSSSLMGAYVVGMRQSSSLQSRPQAWHNRSASSNSNSIPSPESSFGVSRYRFAGL